MKKVKEVVLPALEKYWNVLKTKTVLKADVVNNLTSTTVDAPLSANQGKILKDEINSLNENFNFKVPNGSDISDEEYRKFGFYSGSNLIDIPSDAPAGSWFQWISFPLNGNIRYPAQIGFWTDAGTVKMYARSAGADGNAVFKDWSEIITKSTIKTVSGVLTETAAQAFNIGGSGGTPYLLSAQIQLTPGVWSDMRTIEEFVRIDNNDKQVNIVKTTAAKYVGYQVRFAFLRL